MTRYEYAWKGKDGSGRGKQKTVWGLSIYSPDSQLHPNHYSGCIDVNVVGRDLCIWTDGKYRYVSHKKAIRLLKELLKRLEQ